MHKPLFLAHRGDTTNFPENTLDSFASAFEKGADGIELDIHLDKNNQLIVVHDYLYDKNQKYPLLSTVFEHFKDSGLLEIEVKSYDISCLTILKDLIQKHTITNFKLTTSIQPLVHHIRKTFPKADIGLIFRRSLIESWMTDEFVAEWLVAHLQLSGANYLHLDLDQYTEVLAHYVQSKGYKLHSHLKTNSLSEYNRVIYLGLNTCTFDDISILELV